jgi:hypothetical protein
MKQRVAGHAKRESALFGSAAAHLDSALGVRPSPGAAGIGPADEPQSFEANVFVDVAAPGDGRTPSSPHLVVVTSRCAPVLFSTF